MAPIVGEGSRERLDALSLAELRQLAQNRGDAEKIEGLLGENLRDLLPGQKLQKGSLLLELLRGAPVPAELADSIDTFGELVGWIEHYQDADASSPNGGLPTPDWPIESQRIRLRPPLMPDVETVFNAMRDPQRAYRLPSRGIAVSPGGVEQLLFGSEHPITLIAETRVPNPVPVLLAQIETMSVVNRRADLVFYSLPGRSDASGLGPHLGLEAVAMFISYVFGNLPVTKLCADVPEWNWEQFSGGETEFFQLEGVRRNHEYLGPKAFDLYEVGIHAESWAPIEESLRQSLCNIISAK